jgi:hypothetical protein
MNPSPHFKPILHFNVIVFACCKSHAVFTCRWRARLHCAVRDTHGDAKKIDRNIPASEDS